MNHASHVAPHVSDGDLVRYFDWELPSPHRRRVHDHLASCEECSHRLRVVEQQTVALMEIAAQSGREPDELTRARARAAVRAAAADHRQRRRRSRLGWGGRAAAVVAGVALVGVIGVGPLRAWVVGQWHDLIGTPAAELSMPSEPAAPATDLERGSVVTFQPAGPVFVLEVAAAQQHGEVRIELRDDVARVSAEIVDGRNEALVVLPSGVQVENSPASTATYIVTLPVEVHEVQVLAGGQPIRVLSTEGLRTPWSTTIPLRW